jgi:hypothetical protein
MLNVRVGAYIQLLCVLHGHACVPQMRCMLLDACLTVIRAADCIVKLVALNSVQTAIYSYAVHLITNTTTAAAAATTTCNTTTTIFTSIIIIIIIIITAITAKKTQHTFVATIIIMVIHQRL